MIKLKKSFVKLITTVVVTSSLVFTSVPCFEVNAQDIATEQINSNESLEYGLANNIKDGAILHAWCWSFNTIKDNMKDIAEAGFSTVQTSPANACLAGENGGMDLMGNGKWYYHYQATDWKIGNYQLGTRDEFKAMCEEADKYGVKVIVDVLPNHTTPTLNAVSQDLKNAAGGQDALYHANGFNPITQWNDRYQCTTGEMGGLPDVNTENSGFQKYFLNYLNDCIDCGADGFRYDTAKHIGLPSDPLDAKSSRNNFWPVVTGKESVDGVSLKDVDRIFNYGEVLQDANVKETEYANYISETASAYGSTLRQAIKSNNFSTDSLLNWNHPVSADKLVTWVESHDTYCNDGESTGLSDWQIKMAWAVIAARKGGTPLFFSRPDGSSTSNRWGNNKIGKKGNDAFKDKEVAAVNKFRNKMVGQSEFLRNINGNKQILSIERGKVGQVIINLGQGTTINSDTNLNDGVYTDKISNNKCTVSGGKISGYIEGGKITVLDDYIKPDPIVVDKAGIYFDKPQSWGNDIKAYVYDEKSGSGVQKIAEWPGTEMKKLDNGRYFYELPSTWKYTNTQVIFTDGSNQVPASIGLEYTLGTAMGYINNEWMKLEINGNGSDDPIIEDGCIYFNKPQSWGNDIKVYVYDEKSESGVQEIAKWPGTEMSSLGDGMYYYKLPSTWKYTNTQVIFTDGSNQVPASIGLEYTLGTTMEYKDGSWNQVQKTADKEAA